MTFQKGACYLLAVSLAFLAPASVSAENLSLASIVDLTKSGIGDDAIIAKLKSKDAHYDLSVEEMIDLKKHGVSSAVLAAMMAPPEQAAPKFSMTSPDPMVPHPAGVYLMTGEGQLAQMHRMDSTVSSQAKTGGVFGYALTGGLASASVKVAIPNEHAKVKTHNDPVFYFFFDQALDASAANTWNNGANTAVNSPAEFSLVRLKEKHNRREARVGSLNIAGAKTGVMDKDRVHFNYTMVRPGVYRVEADGVTEPGEYGFIYSLGGGGTAGAMNAHIIDFSV